MCHDYFIPKSTVVCHEKSRIFKSPKTERLTSIKKIITEGGRNQSYFGIEKKSGIMTNLSLVQYLRIYEEKYKVVLVKTVYGLLLTTY